MYYNYQKSAQSVLFLSATMPIKKPRFLWKRGAVLLKLTKALPEPRLFSVFLHWPAAVFVCHCPV